jgi:hypothetical protein
MSKYTVDRVINAVLNDSNLDKMSNWATSLSGTNVTVLAPVVDIACYSFNDYASGPHIMLGRKFYSSVFNNNDIEDINIKKGYSDIAHAYYGAYYHELFHVLYTPFNYMVTLISRYPSNAGEILHYVSNIIEDVAIEGTGKIRYPFCSPYIDFLSTIFKNEDTIKRISEAIKDEPDEPATMLAFLLHLVRNGDLSCLPEYKHFVDNESFIREGISLCVNTIVGTKRLDREIAFGCELLKILDYKEPSQDAVNNPNPSASTSEAEKTESGGKSLSGKKASKVIESFDNKSSMTKELYNPVSKPVEDTEKDVVTKDLKQVKAQRNAPSSESLDSSGMTSDLTKEGITTLSNDDPVSQYSHAFYKMNKFWKPSDKNITSYNDTLREEDAKARSVVALIRKMQSQNNTSWERFQMTGKFDITSTYKKDNFKFFKRETAPSQEADLVFEILVDNSGSMSGTKSTLAGRSLIIFCEALDRLHIPFSVDAFTEGGCVAITIGLKDYSECYSKVKYNMTLFTDQFAIKQLSTFCGNIDEVNFKYVADKLLQRKEKDKIMVVISDGATCGSYIDLNTLAKRYESRGITVLGIGIYDNNVSKIYSNNIVLQTKEDLEKLYGFLNKYLVKKIFK